MRSRRHGRGRRRAREARRARGPRGTGGRRDRSATPVDARARRGPRREGEPDRRARGGQDPRRDDRCGPGARERSLTAGAARGRAVPGDGARLRTGAGEAGDEARHLFDERHAAPRRGDAAAPRAGANDRWRDARRTARADRRDEDGAWCASPPEAIARTADPHRRHTTPPRRRGVVRHAARLANRGAREARRRRGSGATRREAHDRAGRAA